VNGFVVAIGVNDIVYVGDIVRLTDLVIDKVNGFVVAIGVEEIECVLVKQYDTELV